SAKSCFGLTATCFDKAGDNSPNSRCTNVVVTVNKRCNRNAEATRKPVLAKSGWLASKMRSESRGLVGNWLVINAITMCRCSPIGSVRTTAGRTFEEVRSPNGKGTSTTLSLVIERFPVVHRVNIFTGIIEKRKRRTRCCRVQPFSFLNFGIVRHQNNHTYSTYINRQRNIKREMSLVIHCRHCLNRTKSIHRVSPHSPETSTLSATRVSISSNASSPRTAISAAVMTPSRVEEIFHMRQNAQRPGAVVGCPHTAHAWSAARSAGALKKPSRRALRNWT